ncbi:uncharacterized protein LOC131017286 [Salvia miltiorrhiza]|uniref:uncharacterized protein LOC131017286 n=1 Tax=Salvia miltiorrhiza TaxID=226208 RepID=UPI0025ACAD7B|nr:uncharacterized protein LOC131017286 [Salvia miltiorrhiza]
MSVNGTLKIPTKGKIASGSGDRQEQIGAATLAARAGAVALDWSPEFGQNGGGRFVEALCAAVGVDGRDGRGSSSSAAAGGSVSVDGRDGRRYNNSAVTGAFAGVNGRTTENFHEGETKGQKVAWGIGQREEKEWESVKGRQEAHDLGYQDGGDYWAWH